MAVNPSYAANFSVVDRSGEVSGFTINLAAAIDVTALAANTAYQNFLTGLASVCDGTVLRVNAVDAVKISNAAFSNAGQREEKWLVTYQDNVTLAVYATELPCRKQTGAGVLPPTGQDTVDLTLTPWSTFKGYMEAFMFSPDQNAITVLEVRLIGRNA